MLLRQIIELIPRTTSNGWEIAGIYEQLHIAFNILLFGAHQNVHTGPTEHNHIEHTKGQVNKYKKVLDWQLIHRLVDKCVIDMAYQEISNNSEWVKVLNKDAMQVCTTKIAPTSSKFQLNFKM